MPRIARIQFANETLAKNILCGVAAGSSGWGDNPPLPSLDVTGLSTTPLAWKRVLDKRYAVPDTNGAFVLPDGSRWTIGGTPSEHLYLRANFEPTEVSDIAFREVAFHMSAVTQAGLPSGQVLYTNDQVTDAGTLLAIQRRPLVQRNNITREIFETIVTF